jgi:hypothetical protein
MRLAISPAALFVKVTARTRWGGILSTAILCATAAVRVDVLPVPAPANTRMDPG